jgi:hypothetical protein
MSDKPLILVLEASNANPASMPNAESVALQAVGEVLNVDIDIMRIDSANDLQRAADSFNSQGVCILYLVAHGDSSGFALGDSTRVEWKEFLRSFDFKSPNLTSLVLSSCNGLDGEELWEAMKASPNVVPKNVFGYKKPLDWRDALPSSVLLLRALSTNDSADLAAALAAIYLALKLDMWYFVRNSDEEYDFVCGAGILDSICDPEKAEKGWRAGLLEDRGIFPISSVN